MIAALGVDATPGEFWRMLLARVSTFAASQRWIWAHTDRLSCEPSESSTPVL